MNKKSWKTLAIILIVILVIENLFFFWILSLGSDEVRKENECGQVVCQDYDAFYYYSTDEICFCYIDNEIAHREVIT